MICAAESTGRSSAERTQGPAWLTCPWHGQHMGSTRSACGQHMTSNTRSAHGQRMVGHQRMARTWVNMWVSTWSAHGQHIATDGRYMVSTTISTGQHIHVRHMVSTCSAHGRHTASVWPARSQHMVGHGQHMVCTDYGGYPRDLPYLPAWPARDKPQHLRSTIRWYGAVQINVQLCTTRTSVGMTLGPASCL